MKRAVALIAIAVFLAIAAQTMAALPKVDITGTNGGAHWLWVEAEDSTFSPGSLDTYQSYAISGFREMAPFPPNAVRQEGATWIQWQVHIPASMSANTKIMAYCGSHFGRDADISLDGNVVGTMTLPLGSWGLVSGWAFSTMPAISAGDHTLMFEVPTYDINGWDGVLLYDGDITVDGHPTVVGSSNYMYWMGANMLPNSRPVISSGSVTPQFTVSDAVGVKYWISKNGTVSEYTPGTTITETGLYRVWVEAWGSVNSDGAPQEHIIAGVDFILSQGQLNPAVEITGLDGAAHWMWVEAEDANMISQGSSDFTYGPNVSGYTDFTPPLNNYVHLSWNSGPPTIQWLLRIPAAMSNPKVQVHAGAHYGSGMYVSLDGVTIGQLDNLPPGSWGAISGWAQTSLSSGISAGYHVLQLQNWQYEIVGLDGILIYDGDISVEGHPTTVGKLYYNGLQYWMGGTMTPNSRPVINAASVTPNFNVTGIENGGVNYFVDFDGTVTPYTPGTALTEPGVYRVWAEAWGEGLPESEDFPRKHIIVGADFILNNDIRPKPSVEISGLDGAAHWLWIEAEDATSIKTGGLDPKNVETYSGYRANDMRPDNRVFQEYNGKDLFVQWKVTIPAAMSAGYKVIPHGSSHFGDRTVTVKIDGIPENTFSSPQAEWGDIPLWTKISIPSPLSAGVHTLRFEAEQLYEIYSWDGVLLYDGDITTDGYPTLASYPSDSSFMEANMVPVNIPVITASSVTPVFNVSGNEQGGVLYWISKDGAEKTAYTPGTPISGPGKYRVWAEAWAAQWPFEPTIPQKRILAGADFELQSAEITSITDAKSAVDGTTVAINNALVSASFDGYLYIQEGAACGIRVEKSGLNIATPSRVNVVGTVQTNSDGERFINATSVSPLASTDTVLPVGISNLALGGGDFNYTPFPVKAGQEGVDNGAGLNNIGLLVKVWGTVIPVDSTTFKITDGSGVDVYVESLLGGVPTGAPTVAVTGVSSCKMIDGKIQRIIRVDDPNKIQIISGS